MLIWSFTVTFGLVMRGDTCDYSTRVETQEGQPGLPGPCPP